MRIIVDYKDSDARFNQLKIDYAKYLSDYTIRIRFSDGKEKLVDFDKEKEKVGLKSFVGEKDIDYFSQV